MADASLDLIDRYPVLLGGCRPVSTLRRLGARPRRSGMREGCDRPPSCCGWRWP